VRAGGRADRFQAIERAVAPASVGGFVSWGMNTAVEDRIARALRDGPLYEGALELVVLGSELGGLSERKQFRATLARMMLGGKVERALGVGPQAYRLVA